MRVLARLANLAPHGPEAPTELRGLSCLRQGFFGCLLTGWGRVEYGYCFGNIGVWSRRYG